MPEPKIAVPLQLDMCMFGMRRTSAETEGQTTRERETDREARTGLICALQALLAPSLSYSSLPSSVPSCRRSLHHRLEKGTRSCHSLASLDMSLPWPRSRWRFFHHRVEEVSDSLPLSFTSMASALESAAAAATYAFSVFLSVNACKLQHTNQQQQPHHQQLLWQGWYWIGYRLERECANRS